MSRVKVLLEILWRAVVYLMKHIALAIQTFHGSDTGRFFGEDKSMNV